MEYRELRELVHIRHELRRFVTCVPVAFDQGNGGEQRAEVNALLSQMCALASQDPVTLESVRPEVERWRMRLSPVLLASRLARPHHAGADETHGYLVVAH